MKTRGTEAARQFANHLMSKSAELLWESWSLRWKRGEHRFHPLDPDLPAAGELVKIGYIVRGSDGSFALTPKGADDMRSLQQTRDDT